MPFYVIPDSFVFLLGEEWIETGRFIQLICPLLFSRFIFNVVVPSISYTLESLSFNLANYIFGFYVVIILVLLWDHTVEVFCSYMLF